MRYVIGAVSFVPLRIKAEYPRATDTLGLVGENLALQLVIAACV